MKRLIFLASLACMSSMAFSQTNDQHQQDKPFKASAAIINDFANDTNFASACRCEIDSDRCSIECPVGSAARCWQDSSGRRGRCVCQCE